MGGLVGLGIPEIEASRYEEKLKKGNYLIAEHEDVEGAKRRFGIDAMSHEKWSCDDGAVQNSQWPPVFSDGSEASTSPGFGRNRSSVVIPRAVARVAYNA